MFVKLCYKVPYVSPLYLRQIKGDESRTLVGQLTGSIRLRTPLCGKEIRRVEIDCISFLPAVVSSSASVDTNSLGLVSCLPTVVSPLKLSHIENSFLTPAPSITVKAYSQPSVPVVNVPTVLSSSTSVPIVCVPLIMPPVNPVHVANVPAIDTEHPDRFARV